MAVIKSMSDTNGMDVMKPLAPSTKVTCPVFANASNALLVAFPVAVATPAVVWMVSVTSFLEVLVVVFPMVVTDCPPTLIVSLVILPEVLPTAWMVPVANRETPLDVLRAAVLQLAKNTDKSTTAAIGQMSSPACLFDQQLVPFTLRVWQLARVVSHMWALVPAYVSWLLFFVYPDDLYIE